ncbi:response regulator [Cohaesibacter haloalkalitolerans]|uniref:response regulator n=1 Tax=Cohaesibacter haloalkalitolerans TaxID=1162980 RepID=UPI000E649BDB|nr:response regulator [Cohaesibacter haloalkalitolerans]
MTKALERITYVEDDQDIRAIAELALGALGGYQLDLCENGKVALERVPVFHPDLILLDVMMPVMDGTETLRTLKSTPELADIPVVFMTAKAQRHEVQGYKESGAVDVIAKPFDPTDLPARVMRIWELHGRDHQIGETMS